MKKFLESTIKNPMILTFVFICVFFGFPAVARASQVEEFSVVIGVGIDLSKENDYKYDVSLLTFVPVADQNFVETYKVVYSQGDTILDAVGRANLYLGKEIRFAHIKTIALSEELIRSGDDVANLLDFMARENDISASTRIIATKTRADEFMKQAQTLDSESSTKISQIASYNKDDLYSVEATLESFYSDYLGPTKVCSIPLFEIDENVGLNPSTQGTKNSSSTSQGGEKEEKQSLISNTGEAVVLKNGKYFCELSKEELKNINLLSGKFKTGFLNIEDFKGELYRGADLSFEIFGNKTKRRVWFENDVPIVELSFKIKLVLSEVLTDGKTIAKNTDMSKFSSGDLRLVSNEIKEKMSKGFEAMRMKECDFANFYTDFYNSNKKKFLTLMTKGDDNYLNKIVVKVDVSLSIR